MQSTTIDLDVVEAAAPHQVLTRDELRHLGVTPRMLATRVRPGGPWQRLLPGVIMLRNGTPTQHQRIAAALRYAGPGAILTGLTAAQLHGLNRFPTPAQIHVLVPAKHRRICAGRVIVERTTRIPAHQELSGFPVAEATRAVLDAARRMSRFDQVEALLAEAVQRRRTSPVRLRTELEAGSDRGSALPRRALIAIEAGARSTAEGDAYRLAARAGLPPPLWNPRLQTKCGVGLPTPDGYFDQVSMAWEIDSREFHLSPGDYDRTLSRHATLTAAGVLVLHTLPSRLRTDSSAVIEELRATYYQASLRPHPGIIAVE